jgi:L-threonylcarbamoyladenylate synthase
MKNKTLTEKDVAECAAILKNEEILAFPTETVYGVGVVYDSKIAFEKLVSLKKRPPNKPFALMCDSMKQAYSYIDVSGKAKAVMEAFLPGELTVLVHAKKELPEHVTLGTGVIGIRVPDDPFVSGLIHTVGKPCLVTSANRSGEPTSTNYDEVVKIFHGEVGGIVKGKCVSLIPTTIVSLVDETKITLIREGPIPFAKIEEVWRNAK